MRLLLGDEWHLRGHMCDGLEAFQRHEYGPKLDQTGMAFDSEAHNVVRFHYCPFCGEELPNELVLRNRAKVREIWEGLRPRS